MKVNMSIKQRLVSFAVYVRHHIYGSIMVCVIVWLAFVCEHSLWDIWRLQHEKDRLQKEITDYKHAIHRIEQSIDEVSGDPDAMEHFAREKMNMKRENEDVFIIED